ncbi:hypothetical protein [Nocardia sp. CY41]|uniref:hypothetical protein n=1 Tax=Nocardia sp. CY41 TaxID=2608686 RepID=UPI001357F2CF|nr:hypothetical protein [Nocardia sp. CY41]
MSAKFREGTQTVHLSVADVAADLREWNKQLGTQDRDLSNRIKAVLARDPDTPVLMSKDRTLFTPPM